MSAGLLGYVIAAMVIGLWGGGGLRAWANKRVVERAVQSVVTEMQARAEAEHRAQQQHLRMVVHEAWRGANAIRQAYRVNDSSALRLEVH